MCLSLSYTWPDRHLSLLQVMHITWPLEAVWQNTTGTTLKQFFRIKAFAASWRTTLRTWGWSASRGPKGEESKRVRSECQLWNDLYPDEKWTREQLKVCIQLLRDCRVLRPLISTLTCKILVNLVKFRTPGVPCSVCSLLLHDTTSSYIYWLDYFFRASQVHSSAPQRWK